MERIKKYYSAILDMWGFLKPRLDDRAPGWGSESWWDCVMSEASTISDKYKDSECHDFAIHLMNAVLNELQRLAKRGIECSE